MPKPDDDPKNPKPNDGGNADFDPSKLTPEQLAKVAENPDFWKASNNRRLKELLDDQKELKKLKEDQTKKDDEALAEQKKWEELANKRGQEIETLKSSLSEQQTNNALTQALAKESVVDLDAALKLADKGKLKLNEDGSIEGMDEVVNSLKTDKAYLFGSSNGTPPKVGSPSNNNNNGGGEPSGPAKFKRSQLSDRAFYVEHEKEILEAANAGLIEDDITPGQAAPAAAN